MNRQINNKIKILLWPVAMQLADALYKLANWIVFHMLPVTDVKKLHMDEAMSDEEWETFRKTFEQ